VPAENLNEAPGAIPSSFDRGRPCSRPAVRQVTIPISSANASRSTQIQGSATAGTEL